MRAIRTGLHSVLRPHRVGALLLALLSVPPMPPPAYAQASLTDILVVDVAPDSEWLDPEALRQAIGKELGAVAVAPSDPRAADRRGTVHVRVDAATGELEVQYEEARRIVRRVRSPPDIPSIRNSAVMLAGNLARDQTDRLLASLESAWNERHASDWRYVSPAPGEQPTPTTDLSSLPFRKRLWFSVSAEADALVFPEEPNLNVCFAPDLG